MTDVAATVPRALPLTTIRSAKFRSVIGMVLFIMLGFGLIVPVLPLFAKQFQVKEAGVGLLLTAFAAMRLLGDSVTGSLIDRFGERTMASLGAAIVGLSSAAAGAAPNFFMLVVLRAAGGVGSAFFLGSLTAYIIGTIDPGARGRASSLFQAAVGIGITLGPVFGGLLGAVSLRLPLYVYGLVALATAPICLALIDQRVPLTEMSEDATLPQECATAPRLPGLAGIRPLLRDSAYRAALMASASDFWISSALFTLVSLVWVERLGLAERSVGLPLTVVGLAALAVIWHAGSLADRVGRKVTLVPALGVSAATLVLLAFSQSRWEFLALMAALGVASGYSRPGSTSMVGDVASPEQRAVAVGGYRIAADVGALLSPIIAGIVAQAAGFRWAFIVIAVFVAVAFGVAIRARESLPRAAAARPSS